MPSKSAPALEFTPTTVGLLRHALDHFPHNDFIVEPDRRLTYADAERLSRAFAKRLLLLGVTKGTRVAAKYGNSVQWVIAWLAVTRIGGFFMPLSSAYKTGETKKCLRIGDAEFYLSPTHIIGREQLSVVEELLTRSLPGGEAPLMIADLPYLRKVVFTSYGGSETACAIDLAAPDPAIDAQVSDAFLAEIEKEVTPADWMLAIFTSGSTSDPKCVIHTHGAPIRHGTAIIDINEWTSTDRIFAGMPFFWVGGNCYTVIPAMMIGATVVCLERFEAGAALDLMEREQATRVIGWPGVINPLLEHPSLPTRSIPGMQDPVWNPAIAWGTGLGMSETGSNHTGMYVAERLAAAGSVGRPIPFLEHKIVDDDTKQPVAPGETGSIHVRGYSLMAGFYKREREDTFEPDGFYDTQDRGYFKGDFLCFAGRDVGLIKTAGNNVSALEVEAALKSFPGIANAYVVGLEDAALGQIVGAAVVPSESQGVDVEALLASLRSQLSNYKVPKVVRVLDAQDVPVLSNGKMDFRALVSAIAKERTSAG
ncbi:acyl--CoA ligase [Novosphingobium sp. G106]|uniref:class I adenylate-forming enzyme family protein n=1 Tax=Novosphingobium sp. G106 TaxID=2849500 RepID=UPI001C2DA1B6|nr:class I adenylate-forming enzyme family protein [Novosphingobium sp. G106]MBV1688874.1 acyl--CoA ligase [Novosphingobium sp. G106]